MRFTAAEVEVFEPDSDAATGKHAMRIEVAVNEEFLEPTLKVLENWDPKDTMFQSMLDLSLMREE